MLLESIGMGLLAGGLGSIISSLSFNSLSLLKRDFPFICRLLNLGVNHGDVMAMPVVNAKIKYDWGVRLLCNLPAGLSSAKVIAEKDAICEALRAFDVDIRWENGLIVDIYPQKMKKSGIPDLITHVPRHTLAHALVESGCPLQRIADILGHSNINYTRVYTKSSSKERRESLDKLSSI